MRTRRALAGTALVAIAALLAAVGVGARLSIVILAAALIGIAALLVLDRFPVDRRW